VQELLQVEIFLLLNWFVLLQGGWARISVSYLAEKHVNVLVGLNARNLHGEWLPARQPENLREVVVDTYGCQLGL
jgi:hypothetical protein